MTTEKNNGWKALRIVLYTMVMALCVVLLKAPQAWELLPWHVLLVLGLLTVGNAFLLAVELFEAVFPWSVKGD